jgi:hypothetical protein
VSIEIERARILAAAFRMPSVQTMVSRKSSITNAFVNALIPVIPPTADEIATALDILGMYPSDVRCAYCGDPSTEWDHLRPLVLKRRPTGYISEIGNLVPACGKCNQSKGNSNWLTWMRSNAERSPARRGVPDLERKTERLAAYEKWKDIQPINLEQIVGPDAWKEYWDDYDRLVDALKDSQKLADRLKERIRQAHDGLLQARLPRDPGAPDAS